MTVYTLGTGLPVVAQALISSLVEKDRLAGVLSALSIFAIAGKLAAMFVGHVVFGLGVSAGKETLKGALFFLSSALFVCAPVAVGLVAVRKGLVGLGAHRDEEISGDIPLNDVFLDDTET